MFRLIPLLLIGCSVDRNFTEPVAEPSTQVVSVFIIDTVIVTDTVVKTDGCERIDTVAQMPYIIVMSKCRHPRYRGDE